jgi:ABC-type nitrate/sulfonate/bicarbonate transport system substrate-binding protein
MTRDMMESDPNADRTETSLRSRAFDRRSFLTGSGRTFAAVGLASVGGGLLAACSSSGSSPAATSSGSGSGSGSLTNITLQQSYINNAEFAGYYIAQKKGFFAKYGLNVNIVSAGATTDPRTVVANGGAQIGVVSQTSDVLVGIAQGVPYKCFGAAFQLNPGCLMVLASSGIYNVKDLVGKTIGLQDDARQQVLGILASNGISASQVNLQVVGDDATPLVLGKIDAYTAYAFDEPISLKMQGIGTRCYSFSNIGLPGYGDNLIATNDTISSDPDMLARFVKAAQEGWQYSIANPSQAVAVTLDDYPAAGKDAAQQKLQMAAEIPMLSSAATKAHGLLWIDTSVWSGAISTAEASHSLAKPLTVAGSMTQEILERAATVSPT